ncbi:hypothetical protein [Spirosoma harenae]
MRESVFIYQTATVASICRLRLDRHLQIAIVTEISQPSCLHHTLGDVITGLVDYFALKADRLLLIEHYPAGSRRFVHCDTYYLLTFSWHDKQATQVRRRPLPLSEFNEVLTSLQTV